MRLLIVEDDLNTRELFKIFIEYDLGINCFAVKNIAEAISFLQNEKPSCILLDYYLDGEEAKPVIEAARRLYPFNSPEIILVTASSFAEDISKKINVNFLVKKPFDIDELGYHIENICLNKNAKEA